MVHFHESLFGFEFSFLILFFKFFSLWYDVLLLWHELFREKEFIIDEFYKKQANLDM